MPSPTEYKKKTQDLGAGLRISKQDVENHPAGPPRHGELSQAERAFTLASTFLSGVLAISASQLLGAPLKMIDPVFYNGYMAYTKECFAILVTCLTQWWAPTVVRVSGDSSMLGQLSKKKDGSLQCNFANRMVLMANHQLYTDWLYLWWIAYTNNMHGFVYIILKESLKNIPIVGWACQCYNFIFLSRKWEEDKSTFEKHLAQLNKPTDPMWLIIFPEGTNLSASTREKSQAWAKKNGLQDMKHQLLPRSTGLRFCLTKLRESTEWLYDCTIAYEGVPEGQFGQDIFTLRSSFFEGRPPKSVNMHWRRFHIDSIPYQNSKAFEVWLRNRWREKDYMLEYFSRHNRFPADDFWKDHLDMEAMSSKSGGRSIRSVAKPAVRVETEVKSGNWNEFVKIFAPITSVMTALAVAYGASPNDLPIPGGKEFLEQHIQTLLKGGDLKGLPSPDDLEKMIYGAFKMGEKKDGKGKNGEVQALTQENLAKLVKETAINSGMVVPGGPAKSKMTTTAPKVPQQSKPKATVGAKTPVPAPKKVKPAIAKSPLSKGPKPETQTVPVMTKSGIMIKVSKKELERAQQQAKKPTTVVTKDGRVIKVSGDDVEEAEKKKGAVITTANGIPIKMTPNGVVTAAKPAGGKAASTTGAKKTAPSTVAKKPGPAPSTVAKKPAPSKGAPSVASKAGGRTTNVPKKLGT
ncbi:1-acyl-sn-glycerol-3-phosphate acyltransferase gamma [Sporormia fimetaria CBS 119925]|uniref:1-acyl-sn-glycerol-3-phosphate acyltransferase gamma n=1 Tax=Sporormia fimetaria CBS 119925 TaxID=1340428 RepID=A0A6A6V1C5_9PLEO|nr:1-acyl-sn-glycerol-3-phosphate acyltransferase gamma [Sporormia fimetaria CBS 119925]